MQIFEINKKTTNVLVFSGITIVSKKKALKSKKQRVVRKDDNFLLINGNAETNKPLQRYHFRLGQSERIVILKTRNT
jgi:hypothetical protein